MRFRVNTCMSFLTLGVLDDLILLSRSLIRANLNRVNLCTGAGGYVSLNDMGETPRSAVVWFVAQDGLILSEPVR